MGTTAHSGEGGGKGEDCEGSGERKRAGAREAARGRTAPTWDGGGEASDDRGDGGGSGDATAAARRVEMPVTCSAGAERR